MPTLNHTCHEKYDLYCDISIQRCSGACTVLDISSLQRKRLVWWLKTIMRIPKTELCSLHYILLWMLVGAKRYFSRYGWNLKYSTKPSKWSQTIIQNYFGTTMVPIRQEILATHKCPFNKFTGAWKKKKKSILIGQPNITCKRLNHDMDTLLFIPNPYYINRSGNCIPMIPKLTIIVVRERQYIPSPPVSQISVDCNCAARQP